MNLKPPVVHRYPTWNVPLMLQAFTSVPFELLRMASLQFVSFKVTFLVVITSARRISELAALSVREDLCIFHTDREVLRLDPSFLPKVMPSTVGRWIRRVLPSPMRLRPFHCSGE